MDAPYLLALALLEQGGRRAMPLQGRSLRAAIGPQEDPGEEGRRQALELLLRVWQRSEEAPLRRAAEAQSLLLVEVPIEALQEQVPALKARWIRDGDLPALLAGLATLGGGLWSLEVEPRGPLRYQRLLTTGGADRAPDHPAAG
jgi:hypothetical protein